MCDGECIGANASLYPFPADGRSDGKPGTCARRERPDARSRAVVSSGMDEEPPMAGRVFRQNTLADCSAIALCDVVRDAAVEWRHDLDAVGARKNRPAL